MRTKPQVEKQEFNQTSGAYSSLYVDLGTFYDTQANVTLLLADSTYRFRVSAGEPASQQQPAFGKWVANRMQTPAHDCIDRHVGGSSEAYWPPFGGQRLRACR